MPSWTGSGPGITGDCLEFAAPAGVRWVTREGGTVVGGFEDLDVSAGKFTPWERPDFCPWLCDPEKLEKWDTIVFSKADRAFRSMKDASDLGHWCEVNKRRLVFTDDGLDLDFTRDSDVFGNMVKKMFLQMLAMGAEMELRRIRARMTEFHRDVKKTTRWAGGTPIRLPHRSARTWR